MSGQVDEAMGCLAAIVALGLPIILIIEAVALCVVWPASRPVIGGLVGIVVLVSALYWRRRRVRRGSR
jgi:hypothetical protein